MYIQVFIHFTYEVMRKTSGGCVWAWIYGVDAIKAKYDVTLSWLGVELQLLMMW